VWTNLNGTIKKKNRKNEEKKADGTQKKKEKRIGIKKNKKNMIPVGPSSILTHIRNLNTQESFILCGGK
jgi:hypothetical protein